MDVTPLIRAGAQVIQSYAGGAFKISGKIFEGAVIVTPEDSLEWNAPEDFADLTSENFFSVFPPHPNPIPIGGRESAQRTGEGAVNFDVFLLGTGAKMRFLPPELRKALKEQGLSIDAMDTGAACRTYNVLMAEGRRVAAFLLPFHAN